MKVTYAPRDGDRKVWEFDPDDVRQSQAELVERRYGGSYDKFRAGVQTGDSKARRVLLWHLLCRDHHTLRYEDTPDFRIGEVKVENSRTELIALRMRIEKMTGVDDEQRQAALAAVDADLADVDKGRPEAGDGEGKADSPTSD